MTRMWLVDPADMCDQHLLGEHKELHQLVGHIRAGNMDVVDGHAAQGQVDTSAITARHDALVEEMEARGFDHDSSLDYDDDHDLGTVDVSANRDELRERCEDCRARMEKED